MEIRSAKTRKASGFIRSASHRNVFTLPLDKLGVEAHNNAGGGTAISRTFQTESRRFAGLQPGWKRKDLCRN